MWVPGFRTGPVLTLASRTSKVSGHNTDILAYTCAAKRLLKTTLNPFNHGTCLYFRKCKLKTSSGSRFIVVCEMHICRRCFLSWSGILVITAPSVGWLAGWKEDVVLWGPYVGEREGKVKEETISCMSIGPGNTAAWYRCFTETFYFTEGLT